MFLLLLAALSNVDKSQLEAAEIDGAGFWRHLPQDHPAGDPAGAGDRRADPGARPVPPVRHRLGADRGGPGTMTETVSIYAYVQGFQQFETSYAAAMAFAILLIVNLLVILALRRVEIAR